MTTKEIYQTIAKRQEEMMSNSEIKKNFNLFTEKTEAEKWLFKIAVISLIGINN